MTWEDIEPMEAVTDAQGEVWLYVNRRTGAWQYSEAERAERQQIAGDIALGYHHMDEIVRSVRHILATFISAARSMMREGIADAEVARIASLEGQIEVRHENGQVAIFSPRPGPLRAIHYDPDGWVLASRPMDMSRAVVRDIAALWGVASDPWVTAKVNPADQSITYGWGYGTPPATEKNQ